MSVWNDKTIIEIAYRMHMAGATSQQIATEVSLRCGATVSRNAVIGIVHRRGWPRSEAGTGKRAARPKPPPPRPEQKPKFVRRPRQTITVEIPQEPISEPVIPPGRRKTLLTLEAKDCRWPIGDPKHDKDFHFCGGERVEGMPYCAIHVRRAYESPQVRRQITSTQQRKRVLADIED